MPEAWLSVGCRWAEMAQRPPPQRRHLVHYRLRSAHLLRWQLAEHVAGLVQNAEMLDLPLVVRDVGHRSVGNLVQQVHRHGGLHKHFLGHHRRRLCQLMDHQGGISIIGVLDLYERTIPVQFRFEARAY